MIVTQEPFITLNDFEGNLNYRKGNGKGCVYLWGFSLEKNDFTPPSSDKMFFPYYVGKIYDDNYCRTHEHLTSLFGGNLPIFNIEECYKNKKKPIGEIISAYKRQRKLIGIKNEITLPNPSYDNLLYFPEGINLYKYFYTNPEIRNQLDFMFKHFCISYFIPEEHNNWEIDLLEKKIGNLVDYSNLITKRYESPKDFEVLVKTETGNINLNERLNYTNKNK